MNDAVVERSEFRLAGCLRRPRRWHIDDLAGRADARAAALTVVCTLDGAHGGPRPMHGVPLAALLREAEPDFAVRTDFKRMVLVAESEEGYRALFSWNEVFNTAVGEGVLVAWPAGGAREPLALLSLADQATGPRYVKRLSKVTLQAVW